MSQFDEMIATMQTVGYEEKKQFLQYLVQMAERAKHRFSQEDKNALMGYVFEEMDRMRKAIPAAATYKEKDTIFACANFVMGIVIFLEGSPAKLSPDKQMKLKLLTELMKSERYIETTLDDIFEQVAVTETDVNRLLYWAGQCSDEYQKSKLYLGLAHYASELDKLNDGAKERMRGYLLSELRRLMELDSEDTWNALELLADVCKYFGGEDVVAALTDLLEKGRNHINYYAIDTLCCLGAAIPQPVIEALARDLEFAGLTYGALQKAGKADLFPEECATEEYLAKSDLVRWLTYPTELGKVPDEIVYLGRIKKLFRKEVFYVFKFRSDSDTLDEHQKNKWLIGWSSNEGGTFSNFDEFAPYEKETPEKALKLIQKRLIG